MNVRRYRLVAGKHYDGCFVYRANDVLESTRRLDQIFRNKFVEVSDMTPVNAPPDPRGLPPSPSRPPTSPLAVQEKQLAELQAKVTVLERELTQKDVTIASQKEAIEFLKAERDALSAPRTPPPRPSKKSAAPQEDPFGE